MKDLDIGLVDFPTLFQGEEVYLCWKLGEAGIRFWHGIDEGFRGRKPIDAEFLEHHQAAAGRVAQLNVRELGNCHGGGGVARAS